MRGTKSKAKQATRKDARATRETVSARSSAKPKAPAKRKASGKAKALAKAKVTNGARGDRPRLERVAFTMLQVENPTRARSFYEKLLGLERGLSSPDGTWTEYDLPGGGCLALFRHPAGTFERSGGAALAFEVSDLDSLNTRLRKARVRYNGDVIRGPRCRMSNILDSEGNALILHQLDPH